MLHDQQFAMTCHTRHTYELGFSHSIFTYKCLPVHNNNRLRTTCNKQNEQIKLQKCNISYDLSCMQMHQKWKIGTSVIISLDSLRQLGILIFFLKILEFTYLIMIFVHVGKYIFGPFSKPFCGCQFPTENVSYTLTTAIP